MSHSLSARGVRALDLALALWALAWVVVALVMPATVADFRV